MTDGPAAGWYPDPLQRFEHRYWDGSAWTHHVSRGGQATTDAGTTDAEAAGQEAASGSAGGGQGTTSSSVAASVRPETAVRGDGAVAVHPHQDASDPHTTGSAPGPSEAQAEGRADGFAAAGSTPEQVAARSNGECSSAVAPQVVCNPAMLTGWQPATPIPVTNVKAVSSLIASIIWLGGLASVAGIILGILGRREVERSGGRETGAGLAMAGMVIGALGILTTITMVFAIAAFLRTFETGEIAGPDFSVEGDGVDAEGDLSYSLVDVAQHQEILFEERGHYAKTVDDLLQVGWVVSQTVDVEVFTSGGEDWCVQAVSELDPTITWMTSSDDPDGPGPGTC